ncbi:MAG: protein-L-isoaspartate(D-aspartate) O-methyltransferase [Breznakibacter sp.]
MKQPHDSLRHKGLRARLVADLSTKGIHNAGVLDAIGKVPRHLFIDPSLGTMAYLDKALPIAAGQTISQPYTVAFQTQLLEAKAGDKVLEIGTGSGYQAAILAALGVKLYSVERQKELYDKTSKLLPLLGFDLRHFLGDGYKGLPTFAPFDRIIVTAGAPFIPTDLLQQMKVGGVLVIPVGEKSQVMTKVRRLTDTEFEKEEFGNCAFVPMLAGIEKNN